MIGRDRARSGRPSWLRPPGERPWAGLPLLLPAVGFLAVCFAYPLLDVVLRSVSGPAGPTVEHYQRILERPLYLRVFSLTFEIAGAVTLLTLLLGYPVAYLLATARPTVARALLGIVLLPLFTSLMVRTYAWMVLLGREGLVNQALAWLGVEPVSLLYNRAGVLIGMTYVLLPYMVLTLYGVLRGLDHGLLRAAYSLGAGDWDVFRRVLVPLTLPGIAGGCLLVFVVALGYFITPRLLGGDGDQMIATVVEYEFELAVNWGFASALSVVLLVLTAIGFVAYYRAVGTRMPEHRA